VREESEGERMRRREEKRETFTNTPASSAA
jgi:hypothetical protein